MKKSLLFYFVLIALGLCNVSNAQNCISNVQIEQDGCTPFGEYNAFVTFEHSPNVDSVSIFFDGAFFGNHSAEFQPIVLSPILFDPNGSNFHTVEVVSTFSTNCSSAIDFEGVCDFGADSCLSEIFFVDTYCNDGVLQFEINYTFLNPDSEGHVFINDEFVGNATVGENQSQTIAIFNPNPQSVYEVVVRDAEFLSCGDTLTTQVAPCIENCTEEFDSSTSCNPDGTYNLSLFFQDTLTLKVYLDNEFIGRYVPPSTSPFIIDGLEVDTNINIRTITTCYADNPSCCRTTSFQQPECPACEINLTLDEVFCEGFAPAFSLTYDNLNPVGAARFIVNGSIQQDAAIGANNQLFLNPQITNEFGTYIIILQDSIYPSCADTLIIEEFFCDECIVETSNIETECIAGTDNYLVELDIFNFGTAQVFEYFIIHQTGETFGPFGNLGSNGAVQASFEVPTSLQGQFQIFDTLGICNAFFETDVDCNPNTSCAITNVLLDHQCLDEFSYEVFIQFDHEDIEGDTVQITDLSGQTLGFFDVNDQPIVINIPSTNSGIEPFGVTIANPLDSNCIAESNIIGIQCTDCELGTNIIFTDCLSGNDGYVIRLEITNFGSTPVSEYFVSHNATGQSLQTFPTNLGGNNVTVVDIIVPNELQGEFTVVAANGICSVGFIAISDCGNTDPCEVRFIEVLNTECNPNGTYNLTVNYSILNVEEEGDINVTINGINYDVVVNPNLVFIVEGITPRTNSDFDIIQICSSESPNCCAVIEYLPPVCMDPELCAIEIIEVDSFSCNTDGTYSVNVFYEISNGNNDFVDVFVNGGDLQTFDNNGFLSLIGINPRPNSDFDIIEICLNDNPDCCQEFEYAQPNCEEEECEIGFIEYEPICLDTLDLFNVNLFFNPSNTSGEVTVTGFNGAFLGQFGAQQQPIQVGPFSQSDIGTAGIGFVICDSQFGNCCNEVFVDNIPNCETNNNECEVEFIEIINTECNADGTYNLVVNYGIDNVEENRDISVNINGIDYDVEVNPNLVFTVEGITPRANTDFDIIQICSSESPNCCAVIEYLQPVCTDLEPCAIDFIELDSFSCNGNGTYSVGVFYGISNGDNDFVDVFVNGGDVQSFDNNGFLFLTGINPRPNSDFDIIEICLNDNPDCCQVIEFAQPDCEVGEECEIGFIEYEVVCLDSLEAFFVNLFFNSNNTSGEVIITNFEGELVGQFGTQQQPIQVGPFSQSSVGDEGIGFLICDSQFENCCNEVVIDNIQNCSSTNDACEVEFIEFLSTECNSNGTYDLNVSYSILNADNDFIDVTVNGGNMQSFENTGTLRVTNITPRQNSDFDIIEICLNDNANCCSVLEYQQPICTNEPQECNLEIVEAGFNCDISGDEPAVILFLQVESADTSSFTIFVNGEDVGGGTADGSLIEIGPLDPNDNGSYSIVVADLNVATCRDVFDISGAFCEEECFIGELEVEIECLDNGFFTAFISFPYEADHQDGVTIRGNGTVYGSFDGFTQPIIIDSLLASENNDWEFVVIDNQDNNCQSDVGIGEIDCEEQELECIIENIEVFDLECIGGNEYSMSVNFDFGNNSNTAFTFLINGVLMNTTSTNTLPLNVFGVVPNENSDSDVITICLDETLEECCVDFEYTQPACLTNSVDVTLIDGVSISPNPTSEMLYINNVPNEIIGLNIIDKLGRTVKSLSGQNNLDVNVSDYINGIYTIQFFTKDNRVMSRRFVKM